MILLSDSLQYLKGVGPAKSKVFNKLDIVSIEDVLYFFPRRYEDRSNLVKISQVEIGNSYTLKGKIAQVKDRAAWRRGGFSIVEIAVTDETGRIFAIWFNQPYLKDYFKIGQEVILFGKIELYKDRLQISNPEFELIGEDKEDSLSIGRIVPIYPTTKSLTQRFIRKVVKSALDRYISKVTDPLPYNIRKKYNFNNLAQSLLNIHFPQSDILNKEAYRRLSFEEFLLFEIPVILRKLTKGKILGIKHKDNGEIFNQLVSCLPFQLTDAQLRVADEIRNDMSSKFSMQRLLQGEVGSGKTIIAILACAIAMDSGYQVAFMAPTEILAKQHFERIKNFLSNIGSDLKIELLISSIKSKDKKGIYKRIKSGAIQFVVGTHALIQKDVEFNKLGLVVIDEQHKFGVEQRAILPKKGDNPDVLIMTATPIPRTLSMTLYGDLDISVLDELPKGRMPISTLSFSPSEMEEVYRFIRSIVQKNEQVYFVCPVIEESEEDDLKAAKTLFKEFKEDILKDLRIGLVHGQMDTDDTDKVMQDFKNRNIDILVATSVLEVGIDIPNATCMVVMQAERFGLSQLHQLRGRIGRGSKQSFFIVVSDPKGEEAKDRISVIKELSDGFRIAEEDLRIRGPGEFFGKRQHGLTALKIANPVTQIRLLKNARDEAIQLLKDDPDLSKRQNQELLIKIKKTFPKFPRLDIVA